MYVTLQRRLVMIYTILKFILPGYYELCYSKWYYYFVIELYMWYFAKKFTVIPVSDTETKLLVTLVYIHLLLHILMFINGLRTVWEHSWTAPEGSWWKLSCKLPYKLRCQGCHEFFFGLSLPLYAIVLVQGSNWSHNQNEQHDDCPAVVWLLCVFLMP